MTPRRFSPLRMLASHWNFGMAYLLWLRWLPPRHGGRCEVAERAAGALDHRLELVDLARVPDAILERDLLLEVEVDQRLVHGLHAELGLPDLHLRVDLVQLVLADQVADRRVRDHHLGR